MVWGTENATHGRAHLLVPEGCGPSAQVKSASRVLGRPARSLHDAIQRLKHATNDLAHVTPPVELPVFPKDDGSDHFPTLLQFFCCPSSTYSINRRAWLCPRCIGCRGAMH